MRYLELRLMVTDKLSAEELSEFGEQLKDFIYNEAEDYSSELHEIGLVDVTYAVVYVPDAGKEIN